LVLLVNPLAEAGGELASGIVGFGYFGESIQSCEFSLVLASFAALLDFIRRERSG